MLRRPLSRGARLAIALGLAVPLAGWGGVRLTTYWRGHRAIPGPPAAAEPRKVTHADFVGSAACAGCHAAEYGAWRGSTHGRAGGAPDSVALLAKFDGAPIRFRDATVTPTVDASGAHVFRVEEGGREPSVYRVAGVVGGGFMAGGGTQGFFTAMTDGTLRFLPFDFSRALNAWFCNTGARAGGWRPITPALSLAECGDWPPARVLGSLPSAQNCEQCHGSQITITPVTGGATYATNYTSLAINCESCHGPGREHVALMRGPRPAGAAIGMQALGTLAPAASMDVCFQCHALKEQLRPGYLPGDPFDRYWSLLLPTLIGAPYFPDGRVRTFAYQLNQIASPCAFTGGMTCTDCHDPHTQTYRDINRTALAGRFDDRQCTDCHAGQGQAAPAHTHHRAGSPGSRCVACHMPYLQEPLVGNAVPYRRSDHTIAIPRPSLDGAFGITGACRQCHATMTPDELERRARGWWGAIKPLQPDVAGLIQAGRAQDPAQVAEMVLHPESRNRLAQFQGLSHFFIHDIRPDMDALPAVAVARLEALAGSPDDDVAALALASLHLARGGDPQVRRFLIRAVAALGARDDAVRRRWAGIYDIRADAYKVTGDPADEAIVRRKLREIEPAPASP